MEVILVYKPTYNWGAPSCGEMMKLSFKFWGTLFSDKPHMTYDIIWQFLEGVPTKHLKNCGGFTSQMEDSAWFSQNIAVDDFQNWLQKTKPSLIRTRNKVPCDILNMFSPDPCKLQKKTNLSMAAYCEQTQGFAKLQLWGCGLDVGFNQPPSPVNPPKIDKVDTPFS